MIKESNSRHKCLVKAVGFFPGDTVVKNPPANAEDAGDVCSIPGSEGSPGEGNASPLQYSCLENPTDRGGWPVGCSPWGHKELDTTEQAHKIYGTEESRNYHFLRSPRDTP